MKTHDVFICHASEDKERFVRPLATTLKAWGVEVWYDEFSIGLGQSISEQIDKGIRDSKFGIVVISPAFLNRKWPKHELRGLVGRDVEEDLAILPVWHGVTHAEVMNLSSSLADKQAINMQLIDAHQAAIQILRTVRRDLYELHARSELIKMAADDTIDALQAEINRLGDELSEYRCPHCSSAMSSRMSAPIDEDERDWDLVVSYDCGYVTFAGEIMHPCPSDPQFPRFEDYQVLCRKVAAGRGREWICEARPITKMAEKVRLDPGYGESEAHARRRLEAAYKYRARQMSNEEWFRTQTE